MENWIFTWLIEWNVEFLHELIKCRHSHAFLLSNLINGITFHRISDKDSRKDYFWMKWNGMKM